MKLFLHFRHFFSKLKAHTIFLLAFFIPVIILAFLYNIRNIYPFGDQAFLISDLYEQYAPFFREFARMLAGGKGFNYSWNIGLGSNFVAIYAYYLSSPMNLILRFFDSAHIIEAMSILMILKTGLASLTFVYYLAQKFHNKNLFLPLLGMFYALSSYATAYMYNIMWLDCIALVPLVILGLEKLMKEGKPLLYCFSLAVSIFSNYYLSIIVCIFSVLYFLYLMIVETDKKDLRFVLKKSSTFLFYSAVAGGLSAVLIIPSVFALTESVSGGSPFSPAPQKYFSTLTLFFRSLMNVPVSKTSFSKLHIADPNIYCTVAVFLFIPLYCFNKEIKLKERLAKSIMLLFFWISFNLNYLNYFWHGFHFPSGCPARQSFLYIFLVLTMVYEELLHLKSTDLHKLYTVSGFVIFLLIILEDRFTGNGHYSSYIIYVSALFLLFYFLLIHSYIKGSLTDRKQMTQLAFILCIAEVVVNWGFTALNTYHRPSYVNDHNATGQLLSDAAEDSDTLFYRVEKDDRRTRNDGAWDGYHGMSVFSSMALDGCIEFTQVLGLAAHNNILSYSHSGSTPLTDALFSVKYITSNSDTPDTGTLTPDLFTQVSTADYPPAFPFPGINTDETKYLYKNLYTLPLGFMVAKDTESNWDTDSKNPFKVQNSFVKASCGGEAVFERLKTSSEENMLVFTVKKNGDVYFEPHNASKKYYSKFQIQILSKDGTVEERTIGNLIQYYQYPYILKIGNVKAGQTVKVTAEECFPDVSNIDEKNRTVQSEMISNPKTAVSQEPVKAYVYQFRKDRFIQAYNALNDEGLNVTEFKDTCVKGTVTAKEDGVLFTSIGYEKGWSAFVDGKEVPASALKGGMLTIPVSKGTHNIEFKYHVRGLKAGMIVSLCSLSALVIAIFIRKRKKKIS